MTELLAKSGDKIFKRRGRMKKPTTIQLKFSVTDDDPLKDEIFKAFGVLMKLLERNNDEVSRTIDQSAKEADKILKEGRKCYG